MSTTLPSGPAQAEDSCDWCYRAATHTSLAESDRLGLVDEGWYACDVCLVRRVYEREAPQGWDESFVWPFLTDHANRR